MLSLMLLIITCKLYSSTGSMLTNLREIEDDFWDWRMRMSPEYSTTVGYTKYNDRLESFDPDMFLNMKTDVQEFSIRLNTILPEQLPEREAINYAVLRDTLQTFLDGYKWRKFGALNPASFMEGLQRDPEFYVNQTPFDTIGDYVNYLKRLQEMPKQIRGCILSFRAAVDSGRTNHAVSVNRLPDQIDRIIQYDHNSSLYYRPFLDNLERLRTVTLHRRQELRNNAREAIYKLNEELRVFRDFITEEYIPNTRRGWGVSSWEGGSEYYRQCLKWHLSTDITPGQVHRLGIQEVDLIRQKMIQVSKMHGFDEEIQQFLSSIKNNSTFYIGSPEGILRAFRQIISDRISPVLPHYFRYLPDVPLRVVALPTDGPAALYQVSDGKRPALFNVNVVRPDKVPTFDMMALALHEGVPGHHTQISISLESPKLPQFRKNVEYRNYAKVPFQFPFYTAYTEGWSLYAESLGEDMGLYKDDFELMGRYEYEIFRACRLVVDTGIHYFGWTRDQAIDYMMNHTAFERQIIENEVDRYITWPGQACAYKIGELKIRELRRRSEQELGDLFDIRDFHAVVLENGAVPLHLLQTIVEGWIENVRTVHGSGEGVGTKCNHSTSLYTSTSCHLYLCSHLKLFTCFFCIWRFFLGFIYTW